MKFSKLLSIGACALLMAAPVLEAQAKRLGGGLNIGRTAPSPARAPQAVPPKPAQAQPAQQGQSAQTPQSNPAAAAPAAASRSWMGPVAGLAAGLGLAALASYLGLGEELMSFLLILLAVMVAVALFRMMAGRRQAQGSLRGSYGQPAMARSGYGQESLGAEARPSGMPWQAGSSAGGSGGGDTESVVAQLPDISSAEIDQFLSVAREQFTRLQGIWDRGDIHALADVCTPEMTRVLSHQIAERKGQDNHTQVVSLESAWLGMNQGTDDFGRPVDEAQVRFSGLVRESTEGLATPFDEVWTLHRSQDGSGGWMLAGIAQIS